MDEQKLRHVLAEMLQPIEQRLDRIEASVKERLDHIETSLSHTQSRLNTVEHRIMDIGDSVRLAVRQISAGAQERCGLSTGLCHLQLSSQTT